MEHASVITTGNNNSKVVLLQRQSDLANIKSLKINSCIFSKNGSYAINLCIACYDLIDQTMEQTDDIDIILTLNPHGWSTCYFYISDKTFEFTITHVFGDPYTDLISALSALLNGQDEVSFIWFSEPGGQRIKISRLAKQQHKAVVTIEDFGEAFHEEPKSFDLKLKIEMKIKQLITLFYFQLYKTKTLLQDTQFAKDREKEFPFQAFHQFDRLVKSKITV